jgi:hypothetical protein
MNKNLIKRPGETFQAYVARLSDPAPTPEEYAVAQARAAEKRQRILDGRVFHYATTGAN